MPDSNTKRSLNPFVAFLREKIDAIADRRSEQEIAEAIGYHRADVIRRIKEGEARLPLDKVSPIARALEVDGRLLAHLWLVQHVPTAPELFGPVMSANEVKLLEVVRNASDHSDPPVTEEKRRQLEAIFHCRVSKN